MSVLDIMGFEDFPAVADSLTYESLMKGIARYLPGSQTLTMVQRGGRQWCRVAGTDGSPAGYSTARCASVGLNYWDLFTPAQKTLLLTKKVWFGYRYRNNLIQAGLMNSHASMYIGPNGFVDLLSSGELAYDTEYFLEFGIDWGNKTVECWRDGTLMKTVVIPAWSDAQYTAFQLVIGYFTQEYSNSWTTAYGRQFDFTDLYLLIDDGVGLCNRLGAVKVRPLVPESVVLGEGWDNPTAGNPVDVISQSKMTLANKLTSVLKTSTSHTDLTVNFKRPVTDDSIEHVVVDILAFRAEGTITTVAGKTSLGGANSTEVVKTPPFTNFGTGLGAIKLLSSDKTPGGQRWTVDALDNINVLIAGKTGG
ncbi:hypothetical protein D3C80_495380 [compost metagenome]